MSAGATLWAALAVLAAGLLGVRLWDRWLWRIPRLHPWPVRRPDLEGTWQGFLHTSWKAPATGEGMPPINACLVVRQSYWGLRASLITLESRSRTVVGGLLVDEEGCLLWAVYRNEPQLHLQRRSRVHHGCTMLRLAPDAAGGPRLCGPYWTDRGTSGQLVLHWMTRELPGDYDRATALRAACGDAGGRER